MKYAIVAVLLLFSVFAVAQPNYSPPNDVLGAHLNYGRGCAACHAPHSGAYGNGAAKTADPTSGNVALWGQDVGSLVGQTLNFGGESGGTNFPETLPAMSAASPDYVITACLSCHDGNLAKAAMMKNALYESVPVTYGKYNTIPTLLGNDGTKAGNYLNDHPVGLNATVGCGGFAAYQWDCTETNGVIQMNGPLSSKFFNNYGFFVNLQPWNNTAVVTCTSCHNQHLMNVVQVTATNSGQPAGYYQTMFFMVGPYNPGSGTAFSNQTAQFCRQCHGYNSNEMNNGTAVTIY